MSKKPTAEQSLGTTKQMLDELDALMERMLSLPVNELDEGPAKPSPALPAATTPATPAPPALSATLTLIEPPLESPAPTAAAPVEPPRPRRATNPPHWMREEPYVSFASGSAVMPEPTPEPTPLTNAVVPPSLLPKVEPILAQVQAPPTPLVTLWCYVPLLWINRSFDRGTLILGDVGARLRSQTARTILGMFGVALFLASMGWLVKDWLGWNW